MGDSLAGAVVCAVPEAAGRVAQAAAMPLVGEAHSLAPKELASAH